MARRHKKMSLGLVKQVIFIIIYISVIFAKQYNIIQLRTFFILYFKIFLQCAKSNFLSVKYYAVTKYDKSLKHGSPIKTTRYNNGGFTSFQLQNQIALIKNSSHIQQ